MLAQLRLDGILVHSDFNANSMLDVADIGTLSARIRSGLDETQFDIDQDDLVDMNDHRIWVKKLKNTYFGDASLDGEFNSSDLVAVFEAGQYEDNVAGNSTWGTGDWNGDGEFNSTDLVFAFQDGGFEQGPRQSMSVVPEPSALLLVIGAFLVVVPSTRKRH